MKILIFSTAYLPFVGGAELAIKEITDRLSHSPFVKGSTRPPQGDWRDFSFTLITARFKRSVSKHERIGNIDVYRVGFGTPFDKWLLPWLGLRKAKQLELSVSQTNPPGFEVIWSMMASQASIAATWFKELHQDKKLVLTLQEGDEEAHLRRYVFGNDFLYQIFIRSWHVAVFKQADVITAISNYLADRARKNSAAEVVVIPNGVDIKKFEALSSKLEEREEERRKLQIRPEDKVVITTSRLVEKNGVGDLIAAMKDLPENVKLLVLGTGQLEGKLKLEVLSSKLEERVKFLGHVAHEELPSYLHIADVFCRPSLSEGFGSSFVEAMAAGLPVVATPVGGIPDFLSSPPFHLFRGGIEGGELPKEWNDNITGLFCNVGAPQDIAEKIQLLLSDAELRNRIVTNAEKMVRERYDWKGIAEKMKNVLKTGVT